jgi:cytochrome b
MLRGHFTAGLGMRYERLTGIHEILANVLLAAIAVHILAVLAYRAVLKEDLVRALLTGRRAGIPETDSIQSHRGLWL